MSSTARNEGRATLGREDFAAISAFRYALGRMTYIVGDTVNWLIESWPLLHEHARAIITRDLLEEIERDDRAREEGWEWKPLGWDFDRAEWLRLRDYIEG